MRTCSARLSMDPDDDGPVLGMIGRLDPQKGFDLLAEAAPDLIADGFRLVVQGSGSPELVGGLRSIAAARPDRVALDRTLRSGHGPPDLCRCRWLPDAFPVRAVRDGSDGGASLRHAADRPRHRRPRGHGRRRARPSGRGHRLRLPRRDRRRSRLGLPRVRGAISGRRARVGRPHRPWHGRGLRLADRVGARLRGGVPTGRGAPRRTPEGRARPSAGAPARRASSATRIARIVASGYIRCGECGASATVST